MKPQSVLLASVLLVAILSFSTTSVIAETTNSTNISYKNGGPSYIEIQNNLHNFLEDKQMNENATKFMQNEIDKNRDSIKQYLNQNPFPTLNQSNAWAANKVVLAHQESGYAFIHSSTHYQEQMQILTKHILKEMAQYNSNGRNGVPAFLSCEAWHDCIHKAFIPTVSDQQQNEVITNQFQTNSTVVAPTVGNQTQ